MLGQLAYVNTNKSCSFQCVNVFCYFEALFFTLYQIEWPGLKCASIIERSRSSALEIGIKIVPPVRTGHDRSLRVACF